MDLRGNSGDVWFSNLAYNAMIATVLGNEPSSINNYTKDFDGLCSGTNNISSGCAMMTIQFNGGKSYLISKFAFRPENIAFNESLNDNPTIKRAIKVPPTLLIQVIFLLLYFYTIK